MRISINGQPVDIFDGATVAHGLLRYFTMQDITRAALPHARVTDAHGHDIDHDAPLRDGQQLNVEIGSDTEGTASATPSNPLPSPIL